MSKGNNYIDKPRIPNPPNRPLDDSKDGGTVKHGFTEDGAVELKTICVISKDHYCVSRCAAYIEDYSSESGEGLIKNMCSFKTNALAIVEIECRLGELNKSLNVLIDMQKSEAISIPRTGGVGKDGG